MNRIADHIGTNYHNGGDICSTIEQVKRFDIPKPIAPSTINYEVDKMILTKKVNSYIRRDIILDENIQIGRPAAKIRILLKIRVNQIP